MRRACVILTASLAAAASGQLLNEEAKFAAPDGSAADFFGSAAAMVGDTAIIGAPGDDDLGNASGSASIFDVATQQRLVKLTASDGAAGDEFGTSVAIDGGLAIVGAPGADGAAPSSGAAYVFDTATGAQLFKLVASGGANGDAFGRSVAIAGGLALVGADFDQEAGIVSGSASIFDLNTGLELQKLLPADPVEGGQFGNAVAMAGTTAIVGAVADDENGEFAGAVYMFDALSGTQVRKLLASDGARNDLFGEAVAADGSTLVIGASRAGGIGATYIFDLTNGAELLKLTPSDGAFFDTFGRSVALSGSTVVVGSLSDSLAGAAYLYDLATAQQVARLEASDRQPVDLLGVAVAIDATTVLAAAPFDDDLGDDAGAAYLFDVTPPCPADVADEFGAAGPDGQVSFGDLLFALGLLGPCPGGTPGCTFDIADDAGFAGADGQVSFGDFLFAIAATGPCP